MKKILLILILIITGCSKYTDLKDLTIIKSIGIEYNDNYTIYAQIYDEIKKDADPKTKVINVSGKTLKESFNNLKNKVNKKIFLSHIDLLILDTNLDKNKYKDIIDYFIKDNELRNDFLTISSNDINNLLNKTKYNEIEDYIKTNNNVKKISFDEIINYFLENKPIILTTIDYRNNILESVNNEKNRT